MRRVLSFFLIPAVLAMLVSLGFWQLDRAKEKKAYLDERAVRAGLPAIAIESVILGPGQSGVAAQVVGRFDALGQFLWDNRTYEGRPGFHVLTPFVIRDSGMRILIDRGWIPLEGSREDLPRPSIPVGQRQIEGQLYEPLKGFTLEQAAPEFSSPLRQNLDLKSYAALAPFDIQPYVLRLSSKAQDGFVRVWPVIQETSVQRHRAYAVQWFGMAGVFVVIVAAFIRRQRRVIKKSN